MLERLFIENIALIERLDLELGRGFTVLTGETGAGKSIIIDGVNLVLGSRGSRELISYGKQKCRVEAVFDVSGKPAAAEKLSELGIEPEDGRMIVSRELSVSGKSLCRVNGVLLPLSALKGITDLLVDVHGQHEHQSLLDEANHLGVIDAYQAGEITPKKEAVNKVFEEYSEVRTKLASGFISEAERERRIDILKYQIGEIEKAALTPGEEESINEELKVLTNAERITGSLNSSAELLTGERGAVALLKEAVDRLSGIADFASRFNEVYSRLNDLYYELEDAAYSVRDLRLEADFDPRRIDELETRLDVIDSLKHKYGRSIQEVLAFLENASAELEELTGDASKRGELEQKKRLLAEDYRKKAALLTEARKRSAKMLCSLAEEQLKALGMKKARLCAEFSIQDDEPRENGADDVRLLLSANEGEPLKPLSKVASGGELSRIMLALKTVITDADEIPTLVFDEVDTGISGQTANTVGLRMKRIASRHQVLCVTHLPQIAAFADTHFVVSKHEEGGRTVTGVKLLSEAERPYELARIMGAGEGNKAAVSHASELIEAASKSLKDLE